jgi:hypothetical protein
MQNSINPFNEKESLLLESNGLAQLAETRKWTMFVSVLGFIFLALMIVLPTIILSVVEMEVPISAGLSFVIPLLVMGIVYYFPIHFLYQFSAYSKKALVQKSSEMMAMAFRYLKMHYRYTGILIIVVLCLYALILVIMLATGNFPPLNKLGNMNV